jgi:aminoglycoside phosphotransferase (APT) family kinase protein
MSCSSEASAEFVDVVATRAEAMRQARPPLIVLEPLTTFLDTAGLGHGPLVAEGLGDGHSNVTYKLQRGDARMVLRRPPRPPFPASAHDMLREARLLLGLGRAGVRVPAVLAVCEDEQVIGMPFYVMEYLDGVVSSHSVSSPLSSPKARERAGLELVDALAELHALDLDESGLGAVGPRHGYLARQLRRFAAVWNGQRTRDVPELDEVTIWLNRHLPKSSLTSVVHGDYRLGNIMFSAGREVRLQAILDWEMSTLGDPLADLGYLCATWAEPEDTDNPMLALSAATRTPGFPTRHGLRERYARMTGRDLDGLGWYEVLALWKCAIFLEASYRRFLDGTTGDPYFAQLKDGVPQLARAALERMRAPG